MNIYFKPFALKMIRYALMLVAESEDFLKNGRLIS